MIAKRTTTDERRSRPDTRPTGSTRAGRGRQPDRSPASRQARGAGSAVPLGPGEGRNRGAAIAWRRRVATVLTDLQMDGMDGLELVAGDPQAALRDPRDPDDGPRERGRGDGGPACRRHRLHPQAKPGPRAARDPGARSGRRPSGTAAACVSVARPAGIRVRAGKRPRRAPAAPGVPSGRDDSARPVGLRRADADHDRRWTRRCGMPCSTATSR